MIDGAKVRALREERKMSQAQLGRVCEIDSTYLSRIENNSGTPTDYYLGTAKKIADGLGVTVDELLREDVVEQPAAKSEAAHG